jgi:hypothetical protein
LTSYIYIYIYRYTYRSKFSIMRIQYDPILYKIPQVQKVYRVIYIYRLLKLFKSPFWLINEFIYLWFFFLIFFFFNSSYVILLFVNVQYYINYVQLRLPLPLLYRNGILIVLDDEARGLYCCGLLFLLKHCPIYGHICLCNFIN